MICQLYLITPPVFDPHEFHPILMAALEAGDVACVQLRMKNADGGPASETQVRAAALVLMADVQAKDVAFIINDYAELAAELGADGVHVGQDDLDAKAARAIVGKDAIVGVTCHDSRHLAIEAAENRADYVAFGAFFPTETKIAKGHPGPEILKDWSSVTNVPCVAIGGITLENASVLINAGADFIAVVSSIWDHPQGPAQAVREFNALIAVAS